MGTPVIASLLPVHILGGVLALVFGYVALFAAKGAPLHRRSGRFFVYAMVVMSLSGALIASLNGTSISVVAGLLTFYFVATALLTVKPGLKPGPSALKLTIDHGAMLLAVIVALAAFGTGFALAGRGRPEAAPMFIFGIVGLLAAAGDVRMLRAGGIEGPRRIRRHLWRMCFAMWVAAASFFWGPPERVPEMIRIPALLPIPVLTPVAVMLYWLWRTRRRRPARGFAGVAAATSFSSPADANQRA